MAISSRTLSAPSPAAVTAAPGLVVTCIVQAKRGVLSSSYPAWVELGAGPRGSQRATRAPPGSGSGATGLMGCCGPAVEETVLVGVPATSSLSLSPSLSARESSGPTTDTVNAVTTEKGRAASKHGNLNAGKVAGTCNSLVDLPGERGENIRN